MATKKQCSNCSRIFRRDTDFLEGTSRWRLCSNGHLWFNCSCGSTLLLKKGSCDWYHPTKFMGEAAASLFNRLANTESLPHLPSAVLELQQQLHDETTTTSELAESVKKAPFIAADLLSLANAATRSRGQRITSVEHAVVFVGRRALSELVLAAAIYHISSRPGLLRARSFATERFWTESFLAAAIAQHLVKRVGREFLSEDEAYLAACLCNVGKLVGAICCPEATDRIVKLVGESDPKVSWIIAERTVGAPSHCTLGEIGAAIWGLPNFVIDAAQHHHDEPKIGRSGGDIPTVAKVATLANQLVHLVLGEPLRATGTVIYGSASGFGLSPRDVETLVEECTPLRAEAERVAAGRNGA